MQVFSVKCSIWGYRFSGPVVICQYGLFGFKVNDEKAQAVKLLRSLIHI